MIIGTHLQIDRVLHLQKPNLSKLREIPCKNAGARALTKKNLQMRQDTRRTEVYHDIKARSHSALRLNHCHNPSKIGLP